VECHGLRLVYDRSVSAVTFAINGRLFDLPRTNPPHADRQNQSRMQSPTEYSVDGFILEIALWRDIT
jgi:hypothetical protein